MDEKLNISLENRIKAALVLYKDGMKAETIVELLCRLVREYENKGYSQGVDDTYESIRRSRRYL